MLDLVYIIIEKYGLLCVSLITFNLFMKGYNIYEKETCTSNYYTTAL